MDIGPITAIEIGATEPEEVVDFFAAFGFERDRTADGNTLTVGRGATLEIQAATSATVERTGFACGPRAIDIYTPDLDRALEALRNRWPVGPLAEISMGPVHMRQAMISGPSRVQVVLVQSSHRRPSLLDEQPERLFSEIHSVVWCVPDRDAEAAEWVAAGFTKGIDLAFSEPSLSRYLGLPRSPARVEMVMLSDAAVTATRLELMSFPDDVQAVEAPDEERCGVRRVTFACAAVSALGTRTPGGIDVRTRVT